MRVLVFMSDNRPLSDNIDTAEYNSLVAAINAEYCRRHGYRFIYYRPYLHEHSIDIYNCRDPKNNAPRHAAWSKLLSTQKALSEDVDYVVYIDSDCIFKQDKPLDFILPVEEDMTITNDHPFYDDRPCSAFYILKVNDASRQIVREWWHKHTPSRNVKPTWEQFALYRVWKKHRVRLIDNGSFFCESPDQFLRHVAYFAGHNRVQYFRNFIESNHIDYAASVAAISCVAFPTI